MKNSLFHCKPFSSIIHISIRTMIVWFMIFKCIVTFIIIYIGRR
ncbi:unnamed protein product [Schistosoma margrebowiei]|uniref:Uncharacterized protein n=1 Tax=Schistosoma margrebowiei TaxID=48269 RepID=A0A3P8GLT4_9TREM|nr:unnamed protein product [Schistosoma margrebowiei]